MPASGSRATRSAGKPTRTGTSRPAAQPERGRRQGWAEFLTRRLGQQCLTPLQPSESGSHPSLILRRSAVGSSTPTPDLAPVRPRPSLRPPARPSRPCQGYGRMSSLRIAPGEAYGPYGRMSSLRIAPGEARVSACAHRVEQRLIARPSAIRSPWACVQRGHSGTRASRTGSSGGRPRPRAPSRAGFAVRAAPRARRANPSCRPHPLPRRRPPSYPLDRPPAFGGHGAEGASGHGPIAAPLGRGRGARGPWRVLEGRRAAVARGARGPRMDGCASESVRPTWRVRHMACRMRESFRMGVNRCFTLVGS